LEGNTKGSILVTISQAFAQKLVWAPHMLPTSASIRAIAIGRQPGKPHFYRFDCAGLVA